LQSEIEFLVFEFHQPICDLLGIKPRVSKEREAQIAIREQVCGRSFPRSIKEFYVLEDSELHLGEHELVAPEELGDPSEMHHGYLRVAVENQGVVAWYAHLTGSDDPPVLHNNDQWDEDLLAIDWSPCSDTFSSFVFDMIAVGHFGGGYRSLTAVDQFPDEAHIRELQQVYQEGPVSDQPGFRVRRFFNEHGLLRIATNAPELDSDLRAHWLIQTDTESSLYDFARSVWLFGNVAKTLTAEGSYPDSIRAAENVLKRLHQQAT
jgi:hypothetical protein